MCIRDRPKPDQDFSEYATLWEDDYSVLTAIWSQRVEPVVDNKLTVVGHLGWFSSSEILIPAARYQTLDVQSLIAIGDPIFAGPLKMPSYYKTNYVGQPEWKFLLFTAPDGAVLEVLSYDVGVGAVSTMPPWEIFSIVKSVVLLARTGIQPVSYTHLDVYKRQILIDAEDDPGMGRDPSALFRGQLQR